MANVLLLSDITGVPGGIGYSRYIGPYVLAEQIRRAGFSVQIIDFFTQIQNFWKIFEDAVDEETFMIGVSSTFLSFCPHDLTPDSQIVENWEGVLWCKDLEALEDWVNKIQQIISKKAPKARLVLGGGKALQTMEKMKERPYFDLFILGKAESFIVSVVEALKQGSAPPLKMHGAANYTQASFFVEDPQQETKKMYQLSWSNEDRILPQEALPLEIAKGCMYNCKFCYFEKKTSLRKNHVLLKEELIQNYEKFGTTIYHFSDDCFNDTRAKVEELCNMFLSLPFRLEWISYVRVDVAVKFPDTANLLIESGARGLLWGIESFNHEAARRAGKGTDPSDVKAMLVRLKEKYGNRFISSASFIIGLPGESEQSIWSSVKWLKESKALDLVWFFPLNIRPYQEHLDKKIVDYSEYSRNPEKFGFTSISHSPIPNNWVHEHMSYKTARELKNSVLEALRDAGMANSVIQSVFNYPFFRTLGLTHQEIFDGIKQEEWGGDLHKKIITLQNRFLKHYEAKLIGESGPFCISSTVHP